MEVQGCQKDYVLVQFKLKKYRRLNDVYFSSSIDLIKKSKFI